MRYSGFLNNESSQISWGRNCGTKCQKILEAIYNSPKKRTKKKKFDLTVPWYLRYFFFSFCFWKNWRHHNLLSRFTDLYHYWRIYFTCPIFLPLCPSQLLSLVKTFYCCIHSWIYQSKKTLIILPFFLVWG